MKVSGKLVHVFYRKVQKFICNIDNTNISIVMQAAIVPMSTRAACRET